MLKRKNCMRICLISPLPPPFGGISNWTLVIHHMATNFPGIELIQVDTSPRWRAVDDLSFFKRALGGVIQFFGNYFSFLTALRKRPKIVHITTSGSLSVFANWAFCATARLFSIPVIYHIRFGRIPEIAKRNTLEWRALAAVARMSSMVLAISQDTCHTFQQHLPKVRVAYVPNPIDLSELVVKEQNHSERKVALFLGWLLPTKGVNELVEAWSHLAPVGWDLLIAGPGKSEYQQQLVEKYHPTHLNFLGEMSHQNAMQLMANCDLFILPSHTEGFPNVILESMAYGKAIIASSVGAIPEMLAGDCGFLIPPKDIIKLEAALSTLMQDELLRNQLGQRAVKKVQQEYNITTIFERYVQIWQSVASNFRS